MTRDDLIGLGEQLSAENNAAHDLWTWLPSHAVAEKHHEDYADTVCPSNRDVMVEAAMYVAYLKDFLGGDLREHTTEENEWFTRCPCGEDHEEDKET